MAVDIGPKIGIDGEAEFRKQINLLTTQIKTFGSEMQAVTSEFGSNQRSAEALTAKNEVLNKAIDSQTQKLDELKKGLSQSQELYGENDTKTLKWQQAVNNATTDLNKMKNQVTDNDGALDKLQSSEKAVTDETERFGSAFERVGGILKGAGAAMGAVVVAAGAAAIKLGQEVVQQFGELEQNLGGSEAVFGEYAASIQKTGEEAYKNLGVSQSDYLATANKMGALFQGSGVEQQKSLELTEKAMQRAADMASVMGIDMQVALDSVAGAAKGNFTMMDNLGVAMNATSIQAYAASKGLDFVWASASNAEKAEVAMQMFFENTEQYAGNFAKESTETISGSIGLLQAALGSFTAGLGNADADMSNLTGNLVDAFQAVVKNIVPVLENIVAALPSAMGAILQAIGDLLPMLLQTVTQLFTQVLNTILSLLPELIPAAVDSIMTIVGALIDNLPLLINAAVQLVTSLVQGIGEALPKLIPAAVTAITTIVKGLVDNLPMLMDAALQLIMGLTQGLLEALPQLIEALPEIITGIIEFIIGAIPQIIDAGIQLLVALVDAMPDIIKAIVAALPQIINGITTALIGSIPQLIDAGVKLFIALIENLPTIIVEIVKAVPQIISALVKGFSGSIGQIEQVGGNLIKGLWKGISDTGAWLRDKISGFFGGVVDNIKDFFGIHSPSTLFAGLGTYMAQGLGIGFEKTMAQVGKDMQNAIPNEFDLAEQELAKLNANSNFNVMANGNTAAFMQLLDKIGDMKVLLDTGKTVGSLTPAFNTSLGGYTNSVGRYSV
ncbi:phage tail protein [Lacrimispora sp.]|uniref:phage tail protein n=1 Tax=Lacrimispora sp. TaxID=2719234 RepID=UPI0028AF1ECB|nr:phage tail protein [Lacrimispora sp.]